MMQTFVVMNTSLRFNSPVAKRCPRTVPRMRCVRYMKAVSKWRMPTSRASQNSDAKFSGLNSGDSFCNPNPHIQGKNMNKYMAPKLPNLPCFKAFGVMFCPDVCSYFCLACGAGVTSVFLKQGRAVREVHAPSQPKVLGKALTEVTARNGLLGEVLTTVLVLQTLNASGRIKHAPNRDYWRKSKVHSFWGVIAFL